MVKQEERTTLGISKDTHRRFVRYIAGVIAEKGELVSADSALNQLLDRQGELA